MSNLARQLTNDWSEDEATLLYDAPSPSRTSQQRAISLYAVPAQPTVALAPTLATRESPVLLSRSQLIMTAVAALIGAMAAAWSIVKDAPHAPPSAAPAVAVASQAPIGRTAIAAVAPDAPSKAVAPSKANAQSKAEPTKTSKPRASAAPAQTETSRAAGAKAATAPAQDRRADRIAARTRSPERAQPPQQPAAKRNTAPAAAPAPAKSTSNGMGTLRINSRPWSKVFVDGRPIGSTPQMSIAVKPGSHRVKLVSQEFDLERTLTIDVRAGQTVTRSVEMMQ